MSLFLPAHKSRSGLLILKGKGQSWGDSQRPPVPCRFALQMKHYENDGCGREWCEAAVGVVKCWMTFLHFERAQSAPSVSKSSLFLLKEKLLLESWGRVGEEMASGGISMELSCGGGCCHCGSGPASRMVCSSGPASTTAFNSFPFSGNGFFCANSSTACSGVGCGVEVTPGEGMLFSSQSEEAAGEECFSDIPPWSSSSFCDMVSLWCCCWWVWTSCCFCWSSCWSSSFSSNSFWHFACASSLSLMALLKRSLTWINSHSLVVISSLADAIVASSSKDVYRRVCLKSSNPC